MIEITLNDSVGGKSFYVQMIYVEPYTPPEPIMQILNTVTVYIGDDYNWQLILPSTNADSLTVDLGVA